MSVRSARPWHSTSRKQNKPYLYDRFMPRVDHQIADLVYSDAVAESTSSSLAHLRYQYMLLHGMGIDKPVLTTSSASAGHQLGLRPPRILSYSLPPVTSLTLNKESRESSTRSFYSSSVKEMDAYMTLDAPGFIDDYYLHLLEWSPSEKNGNMFVIGLGDKVYTYQVDNKSIGLIGRQDKEGVMITSVTWLSDGVRVAIGYEDGSISIWDIEAECECIYVSAVCTETHDTVDRPGRVSSLSFNSIHQVLTFGGQSTGLCNYDLRAKQKEVFAGRQQYHTEQICALKWSPNGRNLISTSNENKILLWDVNNLDKGPLHSLDGCNAAVKAVAWSPHRPDVVATGGGLDDGKICLWDAKTGNCTQWMNTGSQVTALLWSKDSNELLSAHGRSRERASTENEMVVWRKFNHYLYTTAILKGHHNRILSASLSFDGYRVVSVSSDETVRLWNAFDRTTTAIPSFSSSTLANNRSSNFTDSSKFLIR